ncbi:branched-chain-amino-acid aminotransferase [Clydaea vesicula]|uniref:Branched-chain-amino-acid aminotransferase n=1 Tax=Clydaea vesicula TaxID=447962 RepID=A0AAD5U1Z9_9FUNG|nr:branched-chain-amino-acid aminotransferase [Clydaea vesicula]KAJ3391903.1 branched-chain-amino-acid aminotransferase [Lobulomyces angularis]
MIVTKSRLLTSILKPQSKIAFPSTLLNVRLKSSTALPDIDSSKLKVTMNSELKKKPLNKDLLFGHSFTDHMLTVEWTATKGWEAPKILPYGKLSLDPSAVVFHYAIECFEGMKAYIDKQGKIRLFRPDMNMNRLASSCKRLTLPAFDRKQFLECVKELLKIDKSWIPKEKGYSLYIRPTAIGTQNSLGVGPSNKALMFVICSPVGPYYKTGFSAVSLYATRDYVRAWPGGTGDAKLGSNYASGIRPQIEVAKDGYQQILWMFGKEDYVTEVGTMNFFCYWINEQGEKELCTPPLDGTILPGVTRNSILSLARDWKEFKVVEKNITLPEIKKASTENRLLELFGAGTAAIVSPIKNIRYNDFDIKVPLDPKDPKAQAGPLTTRFAETIMGIQYGDINHKDWSVVID